MQEVEEISSQPSNTRWYHCPITKFRRGHHPVIRLYSASGGDAIRISIPYGNRGCFQPYRNPQIISISGEELWRFKEGYRQGGKGGDIAYSSYGETHKHLLFHTLSHSTTGGWRLFVCFRVVNIAERFTRSVRLTETHNRSYTKPHHIQARTSTSTHSEDESSWGLRRNTPQAPRLCHLRPGRHRANFGLGPIRNESEWWYRLPVNDLWATVWIFVMSLDLFRGCFLSILLHL